MQRRTRQRDAIYAAFERLGVPLTPPQVLDAARDEVPELGQATVYRTINSLLEGKRLSPVELPGEPLRYEIAGRGHHHHFQCRDCEQVFEVRGCPQGLSQLTPSGFKLERHELVLYGLCDRCAA